MTMKRNESCLLKSKAETEKLLSAAVPQDLPTPRQAKFSI